MPRRRGIKGEVTQGERPERYVHLAADGQAYFYESPDRYVPIPAWESFAAVFRSTGCMNDSPRSGRARDDVYADVYADKH